jgi:hypothetical protein
MDETDDGVSEARRIFLGELAPLIDKVQAGDETARPAMEEARRRYYEAMDREGRITVIER